MGEKSIAYLMVVHYTYGWTQRFLSSFSAFFPNEQIIVFNNNPNVGQIVRKTRGNRGESPTWNDLCQIELNFVKKQPFVRLEEMPRGVSDSIYELPTHGKVLDYVFPWLKEKGYEYVWHLEPDCLIKGIHWHDKAWSVKAEFTVIGLGPLHQQGPITMSICPTLWHIDQTLSMGMSFEKVKPNINTGQAILRECCKKQKAATIWSSDFIHYGGGTKRCPFMML